MRINCARQQMDKEQAKFILQARRPGGQDDADPEVIEALEMANQEQELQLWLDEEEEFDGVIVGRLKTLKAPDGLKDAILAGGKVTHPTPLWKQPAYLAVAACFAVLLTLTFLSMPSSAEAQPVDQFAVEYVAKLTKLSHKGNNLDELKRWLGDRPVQVPRGLVDVPMMGCCAGSYDGRTFRIICFKPNEDGLRPEIHLLVFDREDMPDMPEVQEALLGQHGDWASASWSEAGLSYVMVRVGKKESLKQLL